MASWEQSLFRKTTNVSIRVVSGHQLPPQISTWRVQATKRSTYQDILIEVPFRPTPSPIVTFPQSPERQALGGPDDVWGERQLSRWTRTLRPPSSGPIQPDRCPKSRPRYSRTPGRLLN